MRAVFHHSYFLPWLGYFSKLEFADSLVILDDVGFRRNHIKRVEILSSQGKKIWFCLPVGNNWGVSCNSISLPTEKKYIDKLLQTILFSYGKAQHFTTEYPIIENIFRAALAGSINLIDANTYMLTALRKHLGSKEITIIKSSDFHKQHDKTDRIIDVCKANFIDEIIIGDGRMSTIHNLNSIREQGIKIYRQSFKENHPSYNQIHSKKNGTVFIKGLSIVDALLNIGAEEVRQIISKKIYTPQLINL